MYCLKCGKDTKDNQVFCEICLQSMDQYPVKPGTAVQLPRANEQSAPKKVPARKRPPTAEEQLVGVRKANRRLRFTALLLFLVAVLSVGALIYTWMQPEAAPEPTDPLTTETYRYIP